MKMIGCSSLRFHFMLITYLVILSSVTAPVNAQILNKPADLELDAVVAAINFGITTDQVIGGVTFRAATANSTVGGVKTHLIRKLKVK